MDLSHSSPRSRRSLRCSRSFSMMASRFRLTVAEILDAFAASDAQRGQRGSLPGLAQTVLLQLLQALGCASGAKILREPGGARRLPAFLRFAI